MENGAPANYIKKISGFLSVSRGAILFFIIFAIVAVNSLWFFPIRRELDDNALILHSTVAANARDQITGFLNGHIEALRNIAAVIFVRPDSVEESLARLSKENLAVESVSIIGSSGQELLRKDRTRLVTESDLLFRLTDTAFRYAFEGSVYVSPVFISEVGDPLVTLSVPLRAVSGEFPEEIAVLAADINVRFLVNVVRGLEFGSGGSVYVVDSSGFLIAHPNTSLVLRRVNLLEREIVRDILSNTASNSFLEGRAYANFGGEEVFAAGLPISVGGGWGVVAEQPAANALASQQRAFAAFLLSIIVEIIFAVFLYGVYLNLISTTVQLNVEKRQREAIVNSLVDGILEYDSQSRVVLMNPAAESLLGVNHADVAEQVITPDMANSRPEINNLIGVMYPALAQYASGVKNLSNGAKAMEIHLADGELKLTVTLTQVKDANGNIIGFLKILHDVSREKLFARLRSEFVSIAAHQLRTPLSAIKWTMRLILDGDVGELEAEQKNLLQRGYDTNERMIKLVNDLLNAARIEEGRFGYAFKNAEMEKFLEGIVKDESLEAKTKNIDLKFENTQKDKLLPLFIDPEKLTLALNNLVDNAIKYTPKGGKVTVKLGKRGSFVEISVIDTGVGIPKDEQKRVFSKFFRASNVVRMETEGTGLGLFIVRNIIRRHGGEIFFNSEPGKGTAFRFTLPIKRADVPMEESVPLEEFLETI